MRLEALLLLLLQRRRRVQPARGNGFCKAETSSANNDVKPEILPYLDTCVEGCSGRARSGAEGKRPRAMVYVQTRVGCSAGRVRRRSCNYIWLQVVADAACG
jgi:hypothetical protein